MKKLASKFLDVGDIITQALEQAGMDGLCSGECGCELSDLFPCGSVYIDCVAGVKAKCNCGEGCDFHIKPALRGDTTTAAPSTWISVDGNLPEVDENGESDEILFIQYDTVFVGLFVIDKLNDKPEWLISGLKGLVSIDEWYGEVTHWMLLPEPPK